MTAPPSRSGWAGPHLLGLHGLSGDEIRAILDEARRFSPIAAAGDPEPAGEHSRLRGRIVATLFFEDSTRTRASFTIAAHRLGAHAIDLGARTSSVNKGETLADTARTVAAMGATVIVVRAAQAGAAALIADALGPGAAVINAGDGRHEHPTQGLLDILTLADARARAARSPAERERAAAFDLRGVRVAIVGDVANSRVARSAIAGMTTLGAAVVCVGPPALAPPSLASLGCEVSPDLDAVLPSADAVMMLRVQFERHADGSSHGLPRVSPHGPPSADASAAHAALTAGGRHAAAIASIREYREFYALTEARERRMKHGAVVMHPGPMNRGFEIDAAVADGPRSLVLAQVASGVAVRMAALTLCDAARAGASRS